MLSTPHLGPAHALSDMLLPGLRFAHGSLIIYTAAVYLVIGLALGPLVDLAFAFPRVAWRAFFSLERLAFMGGALAVTGALGAGVALLGGLAYRWIAKHALIQTVLVSLLGVLLLVPVLRFLWLWHTERLLFQKATRSTALTRGSIAADFVRFRTRWYCIRYVEWLRDAQIQPLGDWPGPRPNTRNDTASTMLAQLDERWLAIEA